jgi:hypothetical protein
MAKIITSKTKTMVQPWLVLGDKVVVEVKQYKLLEHSPQLKNHNIFMKTLDFLIKRVE